MTSGHPCDGEANSNEGVAKSGCFGLLHDNKGYTFDTVSEPARRSDSTFVEQDDIRRMTENRTARHRIPSRKMSFLSKVLDTR